MKHRDFIDLRELMDEIFAAAEDFKNAFTNEMNFEPGKDWKFGWPEYRDYYPNYSYPPVNVYMKPEKSLVFEFAMAGFDEKDISLEFKGDYMVFSATLSDALDPGESVKYFKKRLKLKSIKDQKYFVPEDKFNREQVKATLKNAILTVTVPPKEKVEESEGVKIEIVSEEEKNSQGPKVKKGE
jgi:HSP20 family molecular chaperone IbpA